MTDAEREKSPLPATSITSSEFLSDDEDENVARSIRYGDGDETVSPTMSPTETSPVGSSLLSTDYSYEATADYTDRKSVV